MAQTIESLSAAVLTGGLSRRMGTDKALVEMGGRTMLELVVAAVGTVSDDVFLVGDRPAYHRFGLRIVGDDFPGCGALGGIATALRNAVHDRVLVVGCDMPALSPRLLAAMARLDDADAIVPTTAARRSAQGGDQTYETLHAIYRRSCLPAIERRLAAGELKAARFLADVRVLALDESWLREHDRDLASFDNVNTPDDLTRLRHAQYERDT